MDARSPIIVRPIFPAATLRGLRRELFRLESNRTLWPAPSTCRAILIRPTCLVRRTHPSVFLFLIVPFGAMGGYLSVAIGYLLTQAGVGVEQVAELVAISYIPQTWKFLWAPVADTTLSRKTWYLAAGLVSAVGIFVTGAVPADARSLPLLYAAVLVSNVAVTFLAMATESLMVYNTPPELQGRAGGWFQAGNLGGNGLGGGAGLWLAQTLPDPWMAGAAIAVACALCGAALWFVPEPPPIARAKQYGRVLVAVLKDLWKVARSRAGMLALLICFLPIGTGAASNLWSAVADNWHATAGTVALVTGVLSGIVSAIGCLAGGYGSDRMDRKTAYALYGLLMALCAVAMAIAPRTEAMYVTFTLIYAFIQGLTYAGFTAVVLEAIGLGAAATKYNLYASLSNMPIAYMTLVDGWAHTRWGAAGLLEAEAAIGVLGIIAFVVVARVTRRPSALAAGGP
jgi:MFS transporter, PAT family, beta-lactamase induction signal transducer AmpG